MADEKNETTPGQTPPPKIKLTPLNLAGARPPTVVFKRAPGGAPDGVPLAPRTQVKKETSRIDLAEAESAPTLPGEPPPNLKKVFAEATQPVPRGIPAQNPKAETSRIDLAEAVPAPQLRPEAPSPDQTVRVDLDAAADAAGLDQTTRVTPDQTARVTEAGDATTRISLPDATAPVGDATLRITLPDATAPVSVEAPPPRTVKLNRGGPPPRTIILKRPNGAEATAEESATAAESLAEATEKGQTARITIPQLEEDSGPSTAQRKTIRIKRSGPAGSAASKPLAVARPASDDDVAAEAAGIEADETPGGVWSVLALAATLLLLALVYLLCAQSVAPGWPWPGKVV